MGAWALCCFHSLISTQTFWRALTMSVDSCTETKSAPLHWCNQLWQSLEKRAGKWCWECVCGYVDHQQMISKDCAWNLKAHLKMFKLSSHGSTVCLLQMSNQLWHWHFISLAIKDPWQRDRTVVPFWYPITPQLKLRICSKRGEKKEKRKKNLAQKEIINNIERKQMVREDSNLLEGADHVSGQLHRDKECPPSLV